MINSTSSLVNTFSLNDLDITAQNINYQLDTTQLIKQTIGLGQGKLTSTGALTINTGSFTGRSPKDKFIVKDDITETTVNWNEYNIAFDAVKFDVLYNKVINYLLQKDAVWVRDCYACADTEYKLSIRIMNENPWSNLFAYNMFLRPTTIELENFKADWNIVQAPSFKANPVIDGTRQENFAIINFTKKIILIGGTGYTGEIKKGIFSMLNFVLPHRASILSMHCSANIGVAGDTAIFFGLSGTGKTTLSADPNRKLIGDDEHGWSNENIFNFEGGCYAKTINLSAQNEPDIFAAIKKGALLENVVFKENSNEVDFASKSITENTRVSYPINFIKNAIEPSIGSIPKNIFFLTCDATGILPPISKLTTQQAMYHFISGYTAKIAGTETGITEPKSTFSACFGAPFLPLHPNVYAELLGKKLNVTGAKVWLINTGWTEGPYGVGKRIKLAYTRAMINAALNGDLDNVNYDTTYWFNLQIPKTCPNVPENILNPRKSWPNPDIFDEKAKNLASQFVANFSKYKNGVSEEIINAGPKVSL